MSWICYVAGKTGGHIIPGITEAVSDRLKGHKILFITTDAALDASIMAQYPWIDKHEQLALGAVSYTTLWKKIKFLCTLTRAFFTSLKLLRTYKPVKVVSMGGYVSLPVCYAAWVLRIPVVIYELNAVPGAAVKLLAPLAQEVRVCFAQAQNYFKKSVLIEYPVRFSTDDILSPIEARRALGLDVNIFTLFVLGGSQGSRFINQFVQQFVQGRRDIQLIHQTGVHDIEAVRAWYAEQGIPALVFAYRADLHLCYSAADRIITRAGAGALFEILFFKKKTLVIPLQTVTTDHQIDNARAMEQEHTDLFRVLLQSEAPQFLSSIAQRELFTVL